MSRVSTNTINANGIVKNGYHYGLQVWVSNYTIEDCGHPLTSGKRKKCCHAGYYAGYDIRQFEDEGSGVFTLKDK